VGTILNDDTLELLPDQSGSDANQAAAFDSLVFLRDPFHAIKAHSQISSTGTMRIVLPYGIRSADEDQVMNRPSVNLGCFDYLFQERFVRIELGGSWLAAQTNC